ncbi:MAG: hypothetical protein BroJett024_20080 [Alphaproteobacteria bacterium]|nr:MAG: hypothetical protein BroJett024_20080 [Alphaproteobacteria bacterium]
MPRARLNTPEGKTTEWKSQALRAYQRRTLAADALIASTYLAGTNTRRVRRALAALFGGAVGKDTVSRTWRKVKSDWDAWNVRSLAEEPIVRLILDATVVRVRLDRKATSISLLVVIGVRADGQKVLLAIKSMGGESAEAWRTVLDDLIRRGLRRPEFLIVDGAPGLEKAIAVVWDGVPVQRCTVHKHESYARTLLVGAFYQNPADLRPNLDIPKTGNPACIQQGKRNRTGRCRRSGDFRRRRSWSNGRHRRRSASPIPVASRGEDGARHNNQNKAPGHPEEPDR